jgi:hypothetical protein
VRHLPGLCTAFLIIISSSCLLAEDAPGPEKGKVAAERIVEPIEGVNEFKVVDRSTMFRLRATVIAGGKIYDPEIIGKAVLVRSAQIARIDKDGQPRIGAD